MARLYDNSLDYLLLNDTSTVMGKYLLCPSWRQLALLQHVVQGTATFQGAMRFASLALFWQSHLVALSWLLCSCFWAALFCFWPNQLKMKMCNYSQFPVMLNRRTCCLITGKQYSYMVINEEESRQALHIYKWRLRVDKLKFCETVANITEMVLGLSTNIALRTESVQK